jgi:soluble lytic murein transglycosylase
MRGRFFVPILALLVAIQPLPAMGAQSLDEVFAQAQQLMRRGDYSAAEQLYASVSAPHAMFLQARAALANGDPESAEATLQSLFDTYPDSDQTAPALLLLAQVRRAAGDCSGALRAIQAFLAAPHEPLGPYPALQQAQCFGKLGDWPAELSAARTALSIDNGGPRLTQIEALERGAEAAAKLGRKQDALDFYNRALGLASTRGYRAEMLFTTATIARAMGRDDTASVADRFRAIVIDLPETARAPDALDTLIDMGIDGTVSPLQAGTVRLNAKSYDAALTWFGEVPDGSPEAGPAGLAAAIAEVKLGREDDARMRLAALADADPTVAGRALLQLGQLQMRAGEYTKADTTFSKVTSIAPDKAAEGLLDAGLTRFARQDFAGAQDAWQRALTLQPSSQSDAELHFWLSKVLPPGSAAAADSLSQAAQSAPDSYYGLRAQELLDGSSLAMASLSAVRPDWLSLSPAEQQERTAWLASLGFGSPDQLRAEINALPGLHRAERLLDSGMQTEASWEIDAVSQSYVSAKDVAHLSALADWLTDHDLPQLTLKVGKAERDLVGLGNLPRAVQKQVYPAAWGDLVVEQSARYGVDPLLMLAMIRQESSFDPKAQSAAPAFGLTQIVPSTGRNIASRLAIDDFSTRDLFKPAVSLQFGSWFLSQLQSDFPHHPFAPLAAYNAGGGNVSRWLDRYGDDPDFFVELIPFVETQTYLRIVYDNYRHYQLLYGSAPH